MRFFNFIRQFAVRQNNCRRMPSQIEVSACPLSDGYVPRRLFYFSVIEDKCHVGSLIV